MPSKEKQKKAPLLTEIIDEKNYKLRAYIEAFGYSDRSGWFRKLAKLDTFGPVDIARLSYVLELSPQQVFEALYRQVTNHSPEEVVSKSELEQINSQFLEGQPKKKQTS